MPPVRWTPPHCRQSVWQSATMGRRWRCVARWSASGALSVPVCATSSVATAPRTSPSGSVPAPPFFPGSSPHLLDSLTTQQTLFDTLNSLTMHQTLLILNSLTTYQTLFDTLDSLTTHRTLFNTGHKTAGLTDHTPNTVWYWTQNSWTLMIRTATVHKIGFQAADPSNSSAHQKIPPPPILYPNSTPTPPHPQLHPSPPISPT